jgi:hypothetical protein
MGTSIIFSWASWGNYYLYKLPSKYVIIAEHTNDSNAPFPTGFTKPCKHFHAGTTPDAINASFSQLSLLSLNSEKERMILLLLSNE